MLTGILQGTV